MNKTLSDYINTYVDFPEPGISFKDIMPILWHPEAMSLCIDALMQAANQFDFDIIAGFEARGFLLGTPLAYALKKPFIPLRKAGKLPGNTATQGYALEYGEAIIEIQTHMITTGTRVLLFDDLLATAGTLKAGIQLIEKLGGIVAGTLTLIELLDLKGREKLTNYHNHSIIQF